MFKPGDIVKCIDDKSHGFKGEKLLKINDLYTIVRVNYTNVSLKNINWFWINNRFILVKRPGAHKIIQQKRFEILLKGQIKI